MPKTTTKKNRRLLQIRTLKREIKKLLKKGEAVYVEHSANTSKLV